MSAFKSVLRSFDQLSFRTIISIAFFIAILFAVPVGVYLVQQQTRINSRAAYEKPKLASEPKATPGPIPSQPPILGRVFPWVGKKGDIAWIQGKNFGTNPIEKKLVIGGVIITDNDIAAWDDTLIQVFIPDNAPVTGRVELTVGSYPKQISQPYTLYDHSTKVKLHKVNNLITADNASEVVKATIWTGDDTIPTQEHQVDVQFEAGKQTNIFDTQGLPLLALLLFDKNNRAVSYYVDPVEFDF